MKNILLNSAFILLIGMASCSKEDALNPTSQSQEIPTAVVQSVTSAFPTAQVNYTVIKSNSLYGADVQTTSSGSDKQLILDGSGKIKESSTQINQADLPKTISDYLEANFKGFTFGKAFKKTTGTIGYRVDIQFNAERYSLFFDEAGALVSQIKGMAGKQGGKGERPAPAATQVALADLPTAVQTALAGYTFKSAVVMVDKNNVTRYHVHAEKDGIVYDLDYDSTGKLLESHQENGKGAVVTKTELTVLPNEIKTYLNTNAAGWVLKNAVIIKKDSVAIHYHVVVTVGGNTLTYMFDGNYNAIQNAGKGPKDNPTPPNYVVTELTKTQLSAAIITYLDTNYAGWTLDKAVSISKDSIVDEYEVFITLNSKKYKIEFDETGKFESARLL
ncbi:MAG: PepSY-like domain-containing protein [Aquirufa sp.]